MTISQYTWEWQRKNHLFHFCEKIYFFGQMVDDNLLIQLRMAKEEKKHLFNFCVKILFCEIVDDNLPIHQGYGKEKNIYFIFVKNISLGQMVDLQIEIKIERQKGEMETEREIERKRINEMVS